MITLITTWATEKIVAIFVVSLVAVAAVPTTLILTTEHQVTVTVRQQQLQQQTILVQTVKKTGDDLILKLQSAEVSCNTQVTTLASTNAAKIQTQLASAQTQIHGSITPFIAAVRHDQEHFANLAVITPENEEQELAHLQLISVTALGDGQTAGVVTVTCGSVVVQIQTVIQVVVLKVVPVPCVPHTQTEIEGNHVHIDTKCERD
jgi:hypothetical protein